MKQLSQHWKVTVAFCLGVLCTYTLSSLTNNPFTADVTSSVLDERSNGVIRTQEAEITRLRTLITELSKTYNFPLEEKIIDPQAGNCTSHDECQSIAEVCKENTCTQLEEPACSCGSSATNAFVQCISNNGEGNEARTVICENGCSNDPAPHCV